FVAAIAEAQQAALDDMPPLRLPLPDRIEAALEHGLPPLSYAAHLRDPGWMDVLRRMLRRIADGSEGTARVTALRLEGSRDELYEAQASKLLSGTTFGLDIACAPLVGAGLQVYFTHLAIALGERAFGPIASPSFCPCCGFRPTASITRIGGEE